MVDMSAQSHTIDLPAGRFHYMSWGAERTDFPTRYCYTELQVPRKAGYA